ncbi:phosphate propanoyltransferase [Enterococcus florum]|uniref:Phosphate propanoyltransferase n=1 Tax=Enterococcus florum TaxID=2480627 RepID=A0A4P5P6T5_9ENTE|nr:phosphate propanoyltransferase [Enterococcus florum]GCF93126.1 phosphate propanoyltransferase [Enterococcus florum]
MKSIQFSDEQLSKVAHKLLQQIKETQKRSEKNQIPVGISNRHIHLSQPDFVTLFGSGAELSPKSYLSQPGQFAANQTVTVVGTKKTIHHVRVLGPFRSVSQLEISRTDSFQLGIKAPVNESGNLSNAGSALIVGPKGVIHLEQHVITAKRHIHMSPEDAKRFNVVQGEAVAVKTVGERPAAFYDTIVRINDHFRLECHLDMDEANAAGLGNKNAFVEIIKDR